VLEGELQRGAHVGLVLGEARVGAVEKLVEALLRVAFLRYGALHRGERFRDHGAYLP
jgi:hypothetical protein